MPRQLPHQLRLRASYSQSSWVPSWLCRLESFSHEHQMVHRRHIRCQWHRHQLLPLHPLWQPWLHHTLGPRVVVSQQLLEHINKLWRVWQHQRCQRPTGLTPPQIISGSSMSMADCDGNKPGPPTLRWHQHRLLQTLLHQRRHHRQQQTWSHTSMTALTLLAQSVWTTLQRAHCSRVHR